MKGIDPVEILYILFTAPRAIAICIFVLAVTVMVRSTRNIAFFSDLAHSEWIPFVIILMISLLLAIIFYYITRMIL